MRYFLRILLLVMLLMAPCASWASQDPLLERLKWLKFDADIQLEDDPGVLNRISETVYGAQLINVNTGKEESAPWFGLAWRDDHESQRSAKVVILHKPTVLEVIKTAAEMRSLRLKVFGGGIVLLPKEMDVRGAEEASVQEMAEIVSYKSEYAAKLMSRTFRFRIKIKDTDLSASGAILEFLNQNIGRNIEKGVFDRPVTVKSAVDLATYRSAGKGGQEIRPNLRGNCSFNDFLYAFGLMVDVRFVEEEPRVLIMKQMRK